MMRSMVCFLTLAALLPASAMADWGVQTRITGYYVYDTGQAYITTQNNQNPDGCTNPTYLALVTTSPNFKSIWAQVMTAHTADHTVTLYYDGCDGPNPKIRAIAVPSSW